jgi:GNAT superfamily N-acetyltransferase
VTRTFDKSDLQSDKTTMDRSSWKLVLGNAATLPLVRDLFQTVWNEHLSLEQLQWRYFSNPLGNSPLVVAWDANRGRLAGIISASPVELSVDDRRLNGAQAIDAMTHPDYRNQGVFLGLASECVRQCGEAGHEALYGFPVDSSFNGFINRLQWSYAGKIPIWFRPIAPLRRILGSSFFLRKAANDDVEHMSPSADMLNAFFAAYIDEPRTCRVVRSGRWLMWRYHLASGRNYRWYTRRDNSGALIAWAVCQYCEHTKVGRLAELWALAPDGYARMLRAIVNDADRLDVQYLRASLQRPEINKHLWRAGFIRAPRKGSKLIVRSLMDSTYPASLAPGSHWRINGGDFDST